MVETLNLTVLLKSLVPLPEPMEVCSDGPGGDGDAGGQLLDACGVLSVLPAVTQDEASLHLVSKELYPLLTNPGDLTLPDILVQ